MMAAVVGASMVLVACTTATYGAKPIAETGQPDTWRFKVYVGGVSGQDQAEAAVQSDLETFKTAQGYTSWTIVQRWYNAIPSYYTFMVTFKR